MEALTDNERREAPAKRMKYSNGDSGEEKVREEKQTNKKTVLLGAYNNNNYYKSDGGDSWKFCKEPLIGTRILFCGYGLNNFFTPKRYQIS